jgi:hypothetical protein
MLEAVPLFGKRILLGDAVVSMGPFTANRPNVFAGSDYDR